MINLNHIANRYTNNKRHIQLLDNNFRIIILTDMLTTASVVELGVLVLGPAVLAFGDVIALLENCFVDKV